MIPLSRYRAQLGRGRRLRRADALFETPDPAHAIRALPSDEFFYVLQETGFPEAMEVLLHATPEQVQTVLDFAVWDRDLVVSEKLDSWLEILSAAPYHTVGTWFRGMDVELVALLLRRRATIYDLSHGEPPDEPEGTFLSTPDRLFVLDLRGDEDVQRVTARLIDSLYRYDRDWMRRLLVGTAGDMDAELEESAYRWRSGRMADLGFEDYYQALEVYREIDPATVHVGTEVPPPLPAEPKGDSRSEPFLRVPSALADRLTGSSPFAKAVTGITSTDELAQVHQALVLLCNRVLAADKVTPGDEQATAAVLTRVAATLDLAVEFLARGTDETAVAAVRTIELGRLFQLGTSLTGKVRALAQTLRRGTPFAKLRPALDLFEAEDAENVETLGRVRPVFPSRLDVPPGTGERPFRSLADLVRATAALERAGAAMSLLHGLGARPEKLTPDALKAIGVTDAQALDTGVLARTWLVNQLAGAPAAGFKPVTATLLQTFNKKLNGPRVTMRHKMEIKQKARDLLQAKLAPGERTPAAAAVIDRWTESLDPLAPLLTAGDAPPPGTKPARPRH